MKIRIKFIIAPLILLFFCSIQGSAENAESQWQQYIYYKININLDVEQKLLSGDIRFQYKNNSKDTLSYIYVHLYPNAFKNQTTAYAKAERFSGRLDFWFASSDDYGYIDSLLFTSQGYVLNVKADPYHADICKIDLRNPLFPGDSVAISTPFKVKLPKCFSRLGYSGNTFQLTQWYPKPAVYDKTGWHPMPYLDQGEFYGEFGEFEVNITAPEEYTIAATGNLTGKQMLANRTVRSSYFEKNIHDFAWFAGKNYRTDTISIDLEGRRVLLQSYYPKDAKKQEAWKKSTRFLEDAVRSYSKNVGSYQNNTLSVFQGTVEAGDGMEYPTISVINGNYKSFALDEIVAHETGHNWFYGYLANNERDFPFLDEGLNSFYENKYLVEKYGNYHFDTSLLTRIVGLHRFKSTDLMHTIYSRLSEKKDLKPIGLTSTAYTPIQYMMANYGKMTLGLIHLEHYLGDSTFKRLMQGYFNRWKFHHPYPADFRQAFDENKKLSWFFDDVMTTYKTMDYAIHSINNNKVVLTNKGDITAPFNLYVVTQSGKTDSVLVEGFWGKQEIVFKEPIKSAIIDKHEKTLDIQRQNNYYTTGFLHKKVKFHLFPAFTNPAFHAVFLTPTVGFNTSDKWMPGLAVYNNILTEHRIKYMINPSYSTQGKTIVGNAMINCTFYPTKVKSVDLELRFKKYSLEDVAFQKYFGHNNIYHSLSFLGEIKLNKKNNLAPLSQSLFFASHHMWTNDLNFDNNNQAFIDRQYSHIHEMGYANEYNKNHLVKNSFEGRMVYINQSLNLQLENKLTWKTSLYSSLTWRTFVGLFPIRKDNSFIGNALSFNPISGGNGFGGYPVHDYTFSEVVINRKLDNDVLANQISIREGGFKSIMQLGLSSRYLITSGIEWKVPKLPVLLFANSAVGDFLLFNNSSKFAAESGVTAIIWPNTFYIHFPIITTENIKTDQEEIGKNSFFKRITFTLSLKHFNWWKRVKLLKL